MQIPGGSNASSKRHASGHQHFFSPGIGDTAEFEKRFQEMRDKNEQLEMDVQKARNRELELSQKMEQLEGKFRKEMMKMQNDPAQIQAIAKSMGVNMSQKQLNMVTRQMQGGTSKKKTQTPSGKKKK